MIWVLALGEFDVEAEDNAGHFDDSYGANLDADNILDDGDLDE